MRINFKTLTALWALLILVLTLLPSEKMPETPNWTVITFDKAAHAFVFAVLVFLMSAGFLEQQRYQALRERPVLAALFISAAFGVAIELLQTLLGWGREGSLFDVVSNVTGCLIGLVVFALARQLRLLNLE